MDSRRAGLAAQAWGSHRNAAGLLYGALVSGAVIAVASSVTDSAVTIVLAVVQVLLVYWAAHVYTRVLADRLADPSSSFAARAREAFGHELAVLLGGLPALAAFVVAAGLGMDTSDAADVAMVVTVLLFASAGYAIGRQAGARRWALAGEVATASVLGVVVVALKGAGLH